MTIHILTDSTSDLGVGIAQEFGIGVIPLTATIGGQNYLDGVEIDQDKLFKLVQNIGELPKTSAPSVGEFQEFFPRNGINIFFGISSRLSATIQNSRLAAGAAMSGSIRIVDTLNLSTGIGLLVLKAAELRDSGMQAEEIENEILKAIPKVCTTFIIDTMDYLYKGGRCTAVQAFAGSMLKIHPVIEVRQDGSLGVKGKVHGTRQKCLRYLLDEFEARLPQMDRHRVFVTHTSCPEDAEILRREIIRIASPEDVRITRAGSVVASHCGPGTIGIIFMEK